MERERGDEGAVAEAAALVRRDSLMKALKKTIVQRLWARVDHVSGMRGLRRRRRPAEADESGKAEEGEAAAAALELCPTRRYSVCMHRQIEHIIVCVCVCVRMCVCVCKK